MDRRTLLLSSAALAAAPAVLAAQPRSPMPTDLPAPPVARREPKRIEQLGRVRVDDYAWMKDENWQKVLRDPKVVRSDIREHLEAENAYTRAVLAGTETLQATLVAEMRGRIKEDDSSVPSPDGPWEYYARFETGAQHPVHARRPRGGGAEQVLLDEDAEAKGKAYHQVSAAEHSPDHTLYAWAVDEQGSEVHLIYVKDLATGAVLPGPVESANGDLTWSPDSAWLFWTFRDDNGRPSRILRRPARGGAGSDVEVYHEPDPGFFAGVGVTSSRRWIVVRSGDHETSESRLIPAAEPTAAPAVVEPRAKGVMYDVEHWGDRFVIRTNADDAVDWKLVSAPEATPGKAHWRDMVPHQPGRLITGVFALKDHLIRLERHDAQGRIVVTPRDGPGGGEEHVVRFDEELYAPGVDPGYEYDTAVLRIVYQSPTTPRSWFDYDLRTRERTLRKTQEVPSGHDPSKYVARRLNAPTADGKSVPIFVLMRRDTPTDGSAPLLLYGYGSYGISNSPTFSTANLSLVDRGWIYATACVRGGSEKGWGWFLDGRKFTKTHTFTDFIACAEHLHGQGFGAPSRTVALGGSAGGMLMGAVANLRPDLWTGVVGVVPFVDVLNTMSDITLPLTPPEWPEWGDPLTDPKAYDYIAAYSPYDRVEAHAYPAVLAMGGLSDPRVTYWEPAKWIAKLREHATDANPKLLRINMEAGHGGSAGRFEHLKETALEYAFALWAVDRSRPVTA